MSVLILGIAIFLGVHILTTLRRARAAVIGRLGNPATRAALSRWRL